MKRALMRGGVNAARPAADDGHADVSQLKGQFAGRLHAVVSRHARTDHRHRVFVFGAQLALDVEHNRRIVNLLEQFGIGSVPVRL